ncbi:MAG TPA: hypothetical protein VKR82_09435 [Candidatus Acidoferrales bacterium]|nr:hypothetical protein [Candidatus Acidoferrales bacterium]
MSVGNQSFSRAFRISGILLILGLLVEAISLRFNHPLSFMGFIILGGGLLFFGVAFYLYSLVQITPPK